MGKVISMLFFGIIFISAQCFGQEVIGSAGESIENSSAIINWSIGETMVGSYENVNLHMGEGFNQSNIIINALNDKEVRNFIKVYPNPTSKFVTVALQNESQSFEYKLLSVRGHLLLEEECEGQINNIDLSNLASGTYQLLIKTPNNVNEGSYKIIKY